MQHGELTFRTTSREASVAPLIGVSLNNVHRIESEVCIHSMHPIPLILSLSLSLSPSLSLSVSLSSESEYESVFESESESES